MKNDHDMDLFRLFDEIREPARDELFVERASNRMARHKRSLWAIRIFFSFAAVAVIVAMTPWLMGLTGYIVLGTSFFAQNVSVLILSPAGCSIGGVVGLLFFLKVRL